VLVKDLAWSKRLARYARCCPAAARAAGARTRTSRDAGHGLRPNAYDVIYYAGDWQCGIEDHRHQPAEDEQVQLAKGTRRLQLKNAMRAKFDNIMVPIGGAS